MRLIYGCVLAFALGCATSDAYAQATRTWVSGVGDDANPCSRTAPCKTFAGAISKTAARGEIDTLDSGGFGALTITKAITIDGVSTMAGVLNSGTNGFVINAATQASGAFVDDVVIRNVTIQGAGNGLAGIRVLAARSVTLENVTIIGQNGSGVELATTAPVRLYLRNVTVHSPSPNLSPSKVGISLANSVASINDIVAMLSDVQVSGYPTGIEFGSLSTASLDRVSIANGGVGLKTSQPSAVVRLSDSTITGNSTGILATTGQIISYGNNRIRGNGVDGVPSSTVTLR